MERASWLEAVSAHCYSELHNVHGLQVALTLSMFALQMHRGTVMSDLVQMLSEKNFVVFTMPDWHSSLPACQLT